MSAVTGFFGKVIYNTLIMQMWFMSTYGKGPSVHHLSTNRFGCVVQNLRVQLITEETKAQLNILMDKSGTMPWITIFCIQVVCSPCPSNLSHLHYFSVKLQILQSLPTGLLSPTSVLLQHRSLTSRFIRSARSPRQRVNSPTSGFCLNHVCFLGS